MGKKKGDEGKRSFRGRMNNNTKEQKEEINKKYVVLLAGISAIGVTISILAGAYLYIRSWTPIKDFSAEKVTGGTEIRVNLETSRPLNGQIFYGTSTLYSNKKEIGWIDGKRDLLIGGVLPNKEHYIKFVAATETGRVYDTGFFKIR